VSTGLTTGDGAAPVMAVPSRLLTAEETAQRLAVPKSWVYAEARAGRIPHVKLGRYYRFRPDAIDSWVADLERGPTPYRKYAPGSGPGGSPHE